MKRDTDSHGFFFFFVGLGNNFSFLEIVVSTKNFPNKPTKTKTNARFKSEAGSLGSSGPTFFSCPGRGLFDVLGFVVWAD